MDELQAYTPEEIILSNIAELGDRGRSYRSRLSAHLRELATELSDSMRDGNAFLSSLSDYGTELSALAPENPDEVRALFALEICRFLPPDGTVWQDWFFRTDISVDSDAHNRIAYQRNSYTDEAFRQFSGILRDARAFYPHSFRAICDEIVGGQCEYGILPLESSGEGKLHAFSTLIATYNLKIASVCSVPLGDGRVTEYALLRKDLVLLRSRENRSRMLEIRVSDCTESPVGILAGANICGLSPLRFDYSGGVLDAVFSPSGNLPAFLLYLAMSCPHFEIVGLFRHI